MWELRYGESKRRAGTIGGMLSSNQGDKIFVETKLNKCGMAYNKKLVVELHPSAK